MYSKQAVLRPPVYLHTARPSARNTGVKDLWHRRRPPPPPPTHTLITHTHVMNPGALCAMTAGILQLQRCGLVAMIVASWLGGFMGPTDGASKFALFLHGPSLLGAWGVNVTHARCSVVRKAVQASVVGCAPLYVACQHHAPSQHAVVSYMHGPLGTATCASATRWPAASRLRRARPGPDNAVTAAS